MYKLISVTDLTSSATNSLIAKDNVCLNLVFQSLIHGQVKPLQAIEASVLRGLGLNEFKSFNPSKYSAKNDEWTLNKDSRNEKLSELGFTVNDNSQFEDFAESVMEFVNASREENNKAELNSQIEKKAETASKRKAKESTVASKKGKIGKAITREVEREGEELSAQDILAQMVEVLGQDKSEEAMITLLTMSGYTITK